MKAGGGDEGGVIDANGFYFGFAVAFSGAWDVGAHGVEGAVGKDVEGVVVGFQDVVIQWEKLGSVVVLGVDKDVVEGNWGEETKALLANMRDGKFDFGANTRPGGGSGIRSEVNAEENGVLGVDGLNKVGGNIGNDESELLKGDVVEWRVGF